MDLAPPCVIDARMRLAVVQQRASGSRLDREIRQKRCEHLLLFNFSTDCHHAVAQFRVPTGFDAVSTQR
jgi:hypothetical protein